MVQQGDFEIQLVEANSKVPFKEHQHDRKTYVEVEPGEEYFISIRKPLAKEFSGNDILLMKIHVDGQHLSNLAWPAKKTQSDPKFNGIWKYQNGLSSQTALKFVIPKIRGDGLSLSNQPAVGKVEVEVYQVTQFRRCAGSAAVQPKQISSTVSGNLPSNKKTVRSSNGSVEFSEQNKVPNVSIAQGALLSTITLHYCATPGLIQMGVIPGYHPPANTPEQDHKVKVRKEAKVKLESKRKRSLSHNGLAATKTDESDQDMVVYEKQKAIAMVDLTGIDSDSEDDSKPVAKPRLH